MTTDEVIQEFQKHKRKVINFVVLHRGLNDPSYSKEDLEQDIIFKAWKSALGYRGTQKQIASWFIGIAFNILRDKNRHNKAAKRQQSFADKEPHKFLFPVEEQIFIGEIWKVVPKKYERELLKWLNHYRVPGMALTNTEKLRINKCIKILKGKAEKGVI